MELKEQKRMNDHQVTILNNSIEIDLADIAMEQLALVLEDFPRKDGEVFEFESEFDEETTQKANPFAALAKLKK